MAQNFKNSQIITKSAKIDLFLYQKIHKFKKNRYWYVDFFSTEKAQFWNF